MATWETKIGKEDFSFNREKDNKHNQITIAIIFEGYTVRHIPKISQQNIEAIYQDS